MNLATALQPFFEPLESRQLLSGDGLPTARVDAAALKLWIPTYTFKVVYTDDRAVNASTIDNSDLLITGPNGFARAARLHKLGNTGNQPVQSVYYKVAAPGGLWDAADNGTYTVSLADGQVFDVTGRAARGGKIGTFTVNVAQYPTASVSTSTGRTGGLDARTFGVVADDGVDDTASIQAAIDSLPVARDGVPDGSYAVGGTIILPAGVINTSAPLRLPSSVTLRGQGASTVVLNTSTDSTRGAVELYSGYPHGYNMFSGVESLSIVTTAAEGIRVQRLDQGDLLGLRLSNLRISAGGVGIDLREARAYHTDIRNITIYNPGATAVWMGDQTWVGAVNRISNLTVTGTARGAFAAEFGMVVLGGDFTIENLSIGDTRAPVKAFYGRGSFSIRGLNVTARNLPGNVAATFESSFSVDIERFDGLDATRRLELKNTRDARIKTMTLASGALADALAIDSLSHVTIGTLRTSSDPGPLSTARWLVSKVAAPDGASPLVKTFATPTRPLSRSVVDVTKFGAIPNDGLDDTDAIQRAIDSLPAGNGLLDSAKNAGGGLVLFPSGVFNTAKPIRLPSGVWLRGQGTGTAISNSSGDVGHAAIEFVSTFTHGYNVGAAVEDLTIYTTTLGGIRGDASTITAGLIDARVSNVIMSTGGRGVDMSAVRTWHSTFDNVTVSNPGTTAFWLGDAPGYSADNRVIHLLMQGRARAGFAAEKAIVVLGGEYTYETGWIEHPSDARALPLAISGSATIRGLWLEYASQNMPNGIMMQMENVTRADIDRLFHVKSDSRLNLVNAKNVRINFLNIDGQTVTLRETIAVDSHSRLDLGLVNAQQDTGMLDHPRVKVGAAYNSLDRVWLRNLAPDATANILTDPTFFAFASTPATGSGGTLSPGLGPVGQGAKPGGTEIPPYVPPPTGGGSPQPGWFIRWGDDLGGVTGTASVEQTSAGPRLKIEIISNPNNRPVSLVGSLSVPAWLVGRSAVARWRVDSPRPVVVYTGGWGHEYAARARNGATSAEVPVTLTAGEQILFQLPAAAGVYYISGVSVVAA